MNFLLDNQETERLTFRKLDFTDYNTWLPFHEDKKTSEFWSGLPQDPKIACKQDIDRCIYRYSNNLGGKLALISKQTKEFIGLAGLLIQEVNHKQELEIAYSLLPKFWGNGYASEAAQKCKTYAIKNQLASSLISIIHIDNIPSQKVAIQNGMQIDTTTTYHKNPVHIFRIKL